MDKTTISNLKDRLDTLTSRLDAFKPPVQEKTDVTSRVLQQDIVPNIRLLKPTFQANTQILNTVTYASTVLLDLNASNIQSITLAGNPIISLKNVSIGQEFTIRLIQDATGSRTVTWFAGIKWEGAGAPTLTATANRIDVFKFLCTALNTYDGYKTALNLG